MTDLSLPMMYSPAKGLSGNNATFVDHPALNGVTVGLGTNRSAVGDPGGGIGDSDFAGNWSNCVSIDPTMSQPTTALFQFIVNGLGISIVAVLGLYLK